MICKHSEKIIKVVFRVEFSSYFRLASYLVSDIPVIKLES